METLAGVLRNSVAHPRLSSDLALAGSLVVSDNGWVWLGSRVLRSSVRQGYLRVVVCDWQLGARVGVQFRRVEQRSASVIVVKRHFELDVAKTVKISEDLCDIFVGTDVAGSGAEEREEKGRGGR